MKIHKNQFSYKTFLYRFNLSFAKFLRENTRFISVILQGVMNFFQIMLNHFSFEHLRLRECDSFHPY